MTKSWVLWISGAVLFAALADVTGAQTLSDGALVAALRQGGYVIVMRHAASPAALPDASHANPDNVTRERQLDAAGRAGAIAMGQALRALRIPIGTVLSSPTYRALETARLAALPAPEPHDELGDGGQSMQGVPDAKAAWLREAASRAPAPGSNTFVITHLPNITRAFPDWGSQLADGESAVMQPDGHGGARLVARITIDGWPSLR